MKIAEAHSQIVRAVRRPFPGTVNWGPLYMMVTGEHEGEQPYGVWISQAATDVVVVEQSKHFAYSGDRAIERAPHMPGR